MSLVVSISWSVILLRRGRLLSVYEELSSLTHSQLDISDDGFLSLMNDDGDTKDDVRMPDGEIGEKITKLFKTEEKDTSM